jgi:uncharacterized protein with von Willebrand factor type A (vWA) domain
MNRFFNDKGSRYSSFWMNDYDTSSIFDDLDSSEDKPKRKGKDIVQLAAHRRAIANFVRICTAQSIPVQFTSGGDSYTDGQKVVLSGNLSDKNFDSAVGLALHEASHIVKTDFDSLKNFLHDLRSLDVPNEHIMNIKSIANYIEDRRIDYYMYKSAPGYMGYYDAMYDKYFHSNHIDKALKNDHWDELSYENYMNHIINFTNINRNLDCLPGLREIYNMIDMRNISRLSNTQEVLELAKEVHEFIMNQLPTQDASQDGEGEDSEGQDGDDSQGSGDGDGTEVDSGDKQMKADESAELSDRQKKMIENAVEKQKDFINDGPRKTKLSKRDAKAVNALDKADAQIHEAGDKYDAQYYRKNGITRVIEMDLSKSAVDNNLIPCASTYPYNSERKQEVINKGLSMGTILGRKLKIRNEETSLKSTRRDTGRIDKRLIAELGFGNDRVFSNTFKTEYSDAFIHISIDVSGSMSGDKFDQAMVSAVAVAKACSMIEGIDVKITLRSTTNDYTYGQCLPFVLNAYDSRKDSITKIKSMFWMLQSSGTTPEGLCFEAVMKSIVNDSKGKDAYFVNYSDGMPMFNNNDIEYYYDGALNHTKSQVDTMKRNGIKILSYFISGGYESEREQKDFKRMYGSDAQYINVQNVSAIARTINKKMLAN